MKRFVQIDFLRGLFLIIMTIDHFSSPLRKITYQTFGYVSAAEGFVFVSGLVAGIVYGRRIDKFGIAEVRKKIFSRAGEIYGYHLIILVILTLLIHSFDYIHLFWKDDQLLYDKPFLGMALSAVFLYQPDHLNILPIYCIFLLLTPLAFRVLLQGRMFWLLGISFCIWIASLMGLRDVLSDYLTHFMPVNLGYFNVYSWQLLFFTGLALGYLKKENKLNTLMQNKKLFLFCLILGGLLFFGKHLQLDKDSLLFLTNKTDLGPLRALNFAVLSYIVAYLLYQYKNVGKFAPVVFLGQHSLQVFAFHVLVSILLVPLVNGKAIQAFDNQVIIKLLKVFLVCLTVLSLYISAYLHEKANRKQKLQAL